MLLSALGRSVGINLHSSVSQDDADLLAEQWASALSTGTVVDIELTAGIGPIAVDAPEIIGSDFQELASNLTVGVTLAALESRSGELMMMHACGVALDDGRVVAFVGPSGRGKTTASRALGQDFGYVSDETIAFDANGVVFPYRKPLSIIVEPGRPKRQASPVSLGLKRLPTEELRLASLVLLDRDPEGPDAPEIEPVDLVDAITAILPETSYLVALDTPLQQIAAHADAVGGFFRVRYREASSLSGVVRGLADAKAVSEDWRACPVQSGAPAVAGAVIGRPDADAIEVEVEGTVLVFVDSQMHVLRGIGPHIWKHATGALSDTEILEQVIAEVGPPAQGDAAEIVAEALAALEAAGLLVRVA